MCYETSRKGMTQVVEVGGWANMVDMGMVGVGGGGVEWRGEGKYYCSDEVRTNE